MSVPGAATPTHGRGTLNSAGDPSVEFTAPTVSTHGLNQAGLAT